MALFKKEGQFVKFTDSYSYLLNSGIYTIPDAARLSKVSTRRIRYWLKGVQSEKERERPIPRLWNGQHSPIDGKLALGFNDLQEIRFVDAFLRQGVTWPTLRRAHLKAKEVYKTQHPFCTLKFVTDGKTIFDSMRSDTHGEYLTDIIRGQRVFPQIVSLFLKELKFSKNEELESWWPLGLNKRVVLDPARQFGQPIVAREGVSTEILYQAVRAGQTFEEVADWYEIDVASIKDAVNFESSLLA
jgi:uncharacterized protein (DUF433 family)